MSIGHWIVRGDKTSCGGSVLEGSDKKFFAGMPTALNGHSVSCGKHPGTFHIAGGHPGDRVHGVATASTLYSRSTCPCQARLIPSVLNAWHGPYQEPQHGRNSADNGADAKAGRDAVPGDSFAMCMVIAGRQTETSDIPIHLSFTPEG